MSSSIHAINRANHIYVVVKDLSKVFITLRYMQKRTIGETLQILVKNL